MIWDKVEQVRWCEGWGQCVAALKGEMRVAPYRKLYLKRLKAVKVLKHAHIWRKTILIREDRQDKVLKCLGTRKR